MDVIGKTGMERFRRYVRPDGEHLIWTGGVQFRMPGRPWRQLSPTAAAWELEHGPRPSGMCAARLCDRAGCVRHVGLLSGAEMAHRATVRDVRLPFERLDAAKLSVSDVRRIKRFRPARSKWYRDRREKSALELADLFGVTRHTIAAIRSGRSWAWVK